MPEYDRCYIAYTTIPLTTTDRRQVKISPRIVNSIRCISVSNVIDELIVERSDKAWTGLWNGFWTELWTVLPLHNMSNLFTTRFARVSLVN